MVANLCYRDTEAKLFVITEEAPVEPPSHEDDMPAFKAKQEAFLDKWQGPVMAAYDRVYPKVIIPLRKTRKNPNLSTPFHRVLRGTLSARTTTRMTKPTMTSSISKNKGKT